MILLALFQLKEILINNEITKRVKDYSKNKSDLENYYKVGKILSEAGKHYGDGIIKEYSRKLTSELGKGYTETNLKYFRQFYRFSNSHTVCDYCVPCMVHNQRVKVPYTRNISEVLAKHRASIVRLGSKEVWNKIVD